MTSFKQDPTRRALGSAFVTDKVIARDAAPSGASRELLHANHPAATTAVSAAAGKQSGKADVVGRAARRAVEDLEGRRLMSGTAWGWQATLIGQDQAAANYSNITGAGYSVVVIDSGVDYNHPNLGGGFGAGHKVVAGWDFDGNDANPFTDTNGHGTGSAGVIAGDAFDYGGKHYSGIAPGANVIALRVNGAADIKAAFEWVHANEAKYNIAAVNYVDLTGGNAGVYKSALKQVIADGVFVSRPSGNGGASQYLWPALDSADFMVGSVNSGGSVSGFTTRGTDLDLLAPGEDVVIPYYDATTHKHIIATGADGTSWASPAAVGTAVLLKQVDPTLTPAEMMKIMQDSGTATYDPASKLTFKRLNVNAAIALAIKLRDTGSVVTGPVITPQPPDGQGAGTVAQGPFGGTASVINALGTSVIQAENFDTGLEGVAYHDADATNRGGDTYRSGAGVDLYKMGAGHIVSHAWAGEWLEYTVDVAASGTYTFTATVESLGKGGQFHLEVDGVDVTGRLAAPDTGGWTKSGTVNRAGVALTAGRHVMRLVMDTNGARGAVANFDSFCFAAGMPATTPAPTPTTANFDALSGFNAINYTSASGVGKYQGILGWVDKGDWVGFSKVDFGSAGVTHMDLNVSVPAAYAGKKIVVHTGSPTGAVIGTLTVQSTGSWNAFKTQRINVTRTTGVQDVYLTFEGGPAVANLSWFRFAA